MRASLDPRFDGYTNVLVLGLDDGAGGPETADGTPRGRRTRCPALRGE